MALIQDYVSLETMKTYIPVDANSKFDALLNESITSASRDIDNRTGRTFGKDDAPTTRTYISGNGVLFVDDITTAASIVSITDSNGNELDTSSYRAFPLNGVVNGQPGYPVTRIKSRSFCKGQVYTVEATYGWEDIPDLVIEACKLLAAETFLAKDTPHGVKGLDEFGVVRIRESAQIKKKLEDLQRDPVIIR